MRYIMKTSSKIGLISALLLLAAACGSDEATRSDRAVDVSPLVEVEEIPAGDECEHGGSLIINGVDKDKDGKLSEDEIVSSKPICKNAPGSGGGGNGGGGQNDGSPLIKTHTLDVGSDECPDGGQLVLAGLDANDDGELSSDEIKSSTALCTEAGACMGALPLELVNAEIEQDPFNQYQVGTEYEIRVELNQAIDPSRVNIQDAAGSLGDGPLEYDIDPENDHIAIVKWTPTQTGNLPLLAMIEDGCSLIASDSQLPYANNPSVQVRVSSEAKGLIHEGDKVEICWISRNADSCEFLEFGMPAGPLDINGCMDIELTSDQINHPSPLMDYNIRCQHTDSDNNTTYSGHSASLYKEPILAYFYGEQPHYFDSEGGDAVLYWDTFGMDSCTLSDGTDTLPVDDVSSIEDNAPYLAEVTVTTDFTLTCEDLLNNTHQLSVRYLVGSGIMALSGSLYAPNQSLSIVWETIGVDGTCDVKYSNNGHTLEYTDVAQGQEQEQNGVLKRYTNLYKQGIDLSPFDFTKEQLHEVTCYNADKTKSYSHSQIK